MPEDYKNRFSLRSAPILPVPLYQVIRDRILLDLYQHGYKPGYVLGTEADICRKHGVSRKTVRSAIAQLELAGYLCRRQKVGVIVAEKNLAASSPGPGSHKIILLLPRWSFDTGNWLEREVAKHLKSISNQEWQFNVEMYPYHKPIPEGDEEIYSVIAADPSQQHWDALQRLHAKGVRIIAIEPQIGIHIAVNVYPDTYQAMGEAINLLCSHGHRRIGLLSQPCNHHTFQLWLDGFIQAMSEQGLPILPNAILDNSGLVKCSDEQLRKFSAWFCTTSSNVNVLTQRLKSLNLKVPADVSIIGTDDSIGDGLFCQEVPITVFSPDLRKLNRTLQRLLLMQFDKNAMSGETLYYAFKPTYRNSIAKCKN